MYLEAIAEEETRGSEKRRVRSILRINATGAGVSNVRVEQQSDARFGRG